MSSTINRVNENSTSGSSGVARAHPAIEIKCLAAKITLCPRGCRGPFNLLLFGLFSLEADVTPGFKSRLQGEDPKDQKGD